MRRTTKEQILTTGAVDANGNQIKAEVIDWSRFDKNPVLLYDRNKEGHDGVVVGRVVERRKIDNGYAGKLEFMENFEDADIAYEKYSQGVLPYVSIGGFASGSVNANEVFVADEYHIREVSLVRYPANIECCAIEQGVALSADEQKMVEGLKAEGKEVRYITMCEGVTLVNASEEEATNAAETQEEEATNAAETQEEEATNAAETQEEEATNAAETQEEEATNAAETQEEEVTNAAETQEEEVTNAAELNAGERRKMPLPKGMEWDDNNPVNNQTKIVEMNKKYSEIRCDEAFNARMHQLNAAFRTGASAADNTPENVETVQMLACSMLADERMVILASAMNFTNGVTHQRTNGLRFLVDCAAGGAAAATLAAADLGVIKWLSMFYERLFPNNTFMRGIRFVPMSDREGAIYVESGINPATYVGSITPVNAPRYFYEDIKRTIARQVFSIQPVTFQNAELAILAYDKQSLGWSTAMEALMSDVCTFILQTIANTPSVSKILTSGETVSSSGLFPIEAPSSNVNIKKVTGDDIIRTEGVFRVQNFVRERRVEMVLPSNLYTLLATDPYFKTILTPQLSGSVMNGFEYSGTRITDRNPVARYNTTTAKPELDPSLYADGNVDADGKITDITPAVTTAAHVGAGVAFVEGEVIAGVGAVDVIVMPDPTNYGITMSGWMSTGATVARQDGKGVALIVPDVVTAGA